MRILILGAKGMLGQCLVRVFSDWDVLAWDRNDLDITNAVQVREHIASAKPDIIINAAAYNAVDRAAEETERAMAVNGEAVGYIAEAAAGVGARLVHFSTDYVFGGLDVGAGQRPRLSVGTAVPSSRAATRGRPYEETDKPVPLSVYGRSKCFGEQRVREVAARHPDWRWYIIRTSRLFGPAGASPSAKKSFVDAIVAKSKTTNRIEVVDAEWSAPTYVVDLAQATRDIVCHPEASHRDDGSRSSSTGSFASLRMTQEDVLPSGVYHRTNDGACTWHGFARVILDTIGWKGVLVSVPASRFPRAAVRPATSVLATTKLPPMRGWEEAVKEHLGEILAARS